MKKLAIAALFLAIATSAFAQHGVTLSWTWAQGTGDPATGFIVQRGTVHGGPYTTICGGTGQSPCPNVTQFTYLDTNVVGGGVYYYVIEATGPGGVSTPSNEVKAMPTFLPPQSPINLQQTSH